MKSKKLKANVVLRKLLFFIFLNTLLVSANAQEGGQSSGGTTGSGTTGSGTTSQGTTPQTTTGQGNTTTPTTVNDGKTAAEADAAENADGDNAKKFDEEKAIDPAQAREALRSRILGYELFNNVKIDPYTTLNIATPNNYVLGTADELTIDVNNKFGYSEKIKVKINADGNITLPKVGAVHIGGLSVSQAKRKIASELSRFYVGMGSDGDSGNTTITLSLSDVKTITVQVTGNAVAPGTYTVTSFTTLMNLMYICGGPNEIGTFRKVQLIRNNSVVATLDIYDIIMQGYSNNNVLLHDQDIVQIGPYLSRVAVEGSVKRGGLMELKPSQRLIDAIDYAGGFDDRAYTRQVRVFRNTLRERKIVNVNKIDFDAFEMQNGDSVVVETILPRFENLVTIEGAIFRPGDYSVNDNPTLTQLLDAAEGFQEDALTTRVTISRLTDNLSTILITVNVPDILAGKEPDIALRREDKVYVSSIFDLTEAAYVRIQGAINNPEAGKGITLPYVKNMTVEDVLLQVGGLTEGAALNRIEIARRKKNVDPNAVDAQVTDIIHMDLNPNLGLNPASSNLILQPFDEIFVRSSPNYVPQTFANIEGEVLFPDRYAIQFKDERISDLIKRSGGLTPQAYVEGATLIRKVQLSQSEIENRQKKIADISKSTDGKEAINFTEINTEESEGIGIDLKKILEKPGSSEDLVLLQDDIIRIPKRLETVRVQGEVLYPTSVRFESNKEFMDYISEAGGFNKKALRSHAYVLYPNGSVDRTRRFLVANIYPKIEPGSEVVIPTKQINTQQQIAQTQSFINTISVTIGSIVTLLALLRLSQ